MLEMNGSEIATELGITRQSVSNVLKRAMKKFFIATQKLEPDESAFQISCSMLRMLEVDNSSSAVKKFYMLFPVDIRNEIEKDALENFVSKKERDRFGGSK